MKKLKFKYRLSYTQLIAMSFLAVILVGALLLCLPIASRTGTPTSFTDSLFTAVSATCVTGLVVVDTYTHWSLFGQLVLLVLIQIGGLGFMTVLGFVSMVMKKRISLHQRKLVMQAAGHVQLGGVMTLVKKIFIGTFACEGVGALFLAIRFCPMMGLWEGLYNAVFHAVSAFCNAGFDLFGKYGPFSSLTTFRSDYLVQTVIMTLVILGGLGFFVWTDVVKCRFRFKRYALHTKMVLATTAVLILGGAGAILATEYHGALEGLSIGEKLFCALFQSVTTRTAGMNAIAQENMSGGLVVSIVLMLIGGSPGSTAGGIKTTTILVTLLSCAATIRGKRSATIFKKRIGDDTVKQASAIVTIYVFLFVTATILLMSFEGISYAMAAFEVASAVGTVGLTLGITPTLSLGSEMVLAFLMFVGRVGGFSFVLAFAVEKANPAMERPVEKVLIG